MLQESSLSRDLRESSSLNPQTTPTTRSTGVASGKRARSLAQSFSDFYRVGSTWDGKGETEADVRCPREGFGPLCLSSQIPYYIGEFGDTVEELINYIGVTILVLGFSNFVSLTNASSHALDLAHPSSPSSGSPSPLNSVVVPVSSSLALSASPQ